MEDARALRSVRIYSDVPPDQVLRRAARRRCLSAQSDRALTEQVRRTESPSPEAWRTATMPRSRPSWPRRPSSPARTASSAAKRRSPPAEAVLRGSQAPFSWEPEQVQVLDSGTLALSTGCARPVRQARRNLQLHLAPRAGGKWKIVIDNGCPRCDCTSGSRPWPAARRPVNCLRGAQPGRAGSARRASGHPRKPLKPRQCRDGRHGALEEAGSRKGDPDDQKLPRYCGVVRRHVLGFRPAPLRPVR